MKDDSWHLTPFKEPAQLFKDWQKSHQNTHTHGDASYVLVNRCIYTELFDLENKNID